MNSILFFRPNEFLHGRAIWNEFLLKPGKEALWVEGFSFGLRDKQIELSLKLILQYMHKSIQDIQNTTNKKLQGTSSQHKQLWLDLQIELPGYCA
jgi:hypothetical protein